MKLYRYLLVLVVSCLVCAIGKAQYSYQRTVNPVVTVPAVLSFNLISNSSTTINFSTATQYANGIVISNFNTVQVKSNIPWLLSAASATAYFSASGIYSSSNMPCSILGVKLSTRLSSNPLTTTSTTLNTGGLGDQTAAGNTFNIDLTANPGYNYGPGIYSLTINYTLTPQ